MQDSTILQILIEEDFGLSGRGRWHKSKDHDSLVIDNKKSLFFWNSRGIAGGPLDYLIKIRKMSKSDAKSYLTDLRDQVKISIIKNDKNENVVVYPKLVDIFYKNGLDNREYFYKRGLSDRTINQFQLGFYKDYYTVPFFENGEFKNFQMRRENPKIMFGYYKNIGPLLFNSDILKIVNKIFYTEGPIDAMILIQNGLPAVASNCAGGYSNSWYSKFINQKEIIILFDNDSGGNEESKRLAKFLGENRCKIYNFWDFNTIGFDPVDYFRDGNKLEDLLKLMKEKGKYSFEL